MGCKRNESISNNGEKTMSRVLAKYLIPKSSFKWRCKICGDTDLCIRIKSKHNNVEFETCFDCRKIGLELYNPNLAEKIKVLLKKVDDLKLLASKELKPIMGLKKKKKRR